MESPCLDGMVEARGATTDLAEILSSLDDTVDYSRSFDDQSPPKRQQRHAFVPTSPLINKIESYESLRSTVSNDVPDDLQDLIREVTVEIDGYERQHYYKRREENVAVEEEMEIIRFDSTDTSLREIANPFDHQISQEVEEEDPSSAEDGISPFLAVPTHDFEDEETTSQSSSSSSTSNDGSESDRQESERPFHLDEHHDDSEEDEDDDNNAPAVGVYTGLMGQQELIETTSSFEGQPHSLTAASALRAMLAAGHSEAEEFHDRPVKHETEQEDYQVDEVEEEGEWPRMRDSAREYMQVERPTVSPVIDELNQYAD